MFMDLTPGMRFIILGVLIAIAYSAFNGKSGNGRGGASGSAQ